ncbi:hypothetical protein DLAC_08610 [Tieghemostelium lacteum]|uniref:Uncharacterized protein n=1 Tax=Tieghemostelium lacteum TaxID=361077 RepID=A0A151Z7U5_TIELA|nr:hypothetical protein DLAC_08610 [Tieghemostelium lacteum]|eukprot:KYQ90030.1 hypothetical protein DLAC_08610 [Tieghemostelium lacteum]
MYGRLSESCGIWYDDDSFPIIKTEEEENQNEQTIHDRVINDNPTQPRVYFQYNSHFQNNNLEHLNQFHQSPYFQTQYQQQQQQVNNSIYNIQNGDNLNITFGNINNQESHLSTHIQQEPMQIEFETGRTELMSDESLQIDESEDEFSDVDMESDDGSVYSDGSDDYVSSDESDGSLQLRDRPFTQCSGKRVQLNIDNLIDPPSISKSSKKAVPKNNNQKTIIAPTTRLAVELELDRISHKNTPAIHVSKSSKTLPPPPPKPPKTTPKTTTASPKSKTTTTKPSDTTVNSKTFTKTLVTKPKSDTVVNSQTNNNNNNNDNNSNNKIFTYAGIYPPSVDLNNRIIDVINKNNVKHCNYQPITKDEIDNLKSIKTNGAVDPQTAKQIFKKHSVSNI